MGAIVQNVLFHGIAAILLLVVFIPVAILFLGWLLYIAVESIRDLKKEP